MAAVGISVMPAAKADPFLSAPGARARGMAGAYTAVANDSSAAWHNPAGLASLSSSVTAEWGQAPDLGSDGKASNSATTLFLGANRTKKEAGTERTSAGIYYYTPYTMKYWVPNQSRPNTAYGRINETIQVLDVAYGFSFARDRLKIGFAGGLVSVDSSGTKVIVRDGLNAPSDAAVDNGTNTGLSLSVGGQYRVVDNEDRGLRATAGVTYHSSTISGQKLNNDNDYADRLLVNMPQSLDLGFAVRKRLGADDKKYVLVSTQYGYTDWGGGNTSGRISLGAEFQHPVQWAKLAPLYLAYRAGVYSAKAASGGDASGFWPERRGITLGVGAHFKKRFSVDLAAERATLKTDSGDSSVTMLSLGGTFRF